MSVVNINNIELNPYASFEPAKGKERAMKYADLNWNDDNNNRIILDKENKKGYALYKNGTLNYLYCAVNVVDTPALPS